MDAVTYPDEKVADFIMSRVIPLRVPFDHKPLAADFNLKWTPTLITLDTEGKEHHRTVGFLGPEELVPSLLLGIGKTLFELEDFGKAIETFDQLLKEYPKSDSAPEAIYLRGVSLYKNTHDPKPLRAAYDKLKDDYPESEWTRRAYPYRLIN
jgi:tetratricopeptide (TPR) repeat protein